MTLNDALNNIASNTPQIPRAALKKCEALMLKALQIRGDFPTSLGTIENLRGLVASRNVTVDQIVERVLHEPFMSVRLLSLVNHSYYSRGRTIDSLTGAVNHVGVMNIDNVVEDLAEAKGYKAVFIGRALASVTMQEVLVSSILARKMVQFFEPRAGLGQLTSVTNVLGNAPYFLLSYYRPNIHAAIWLDAFADKKKNFERLFKKIFQKAPADFGVEILKELGIPDDLSYYVQYLDLPPWNRRAWGGKDTAQTRSIVSASYFACRLANEICNFTGSGPMSEVVRDYSSKLKIDVESVWDFVSEVPHELLRYCQTIGMPPFRLPRYVMGRAERAAEIRGEDEPEPLVWSKIPERINPFLYELKACFKTVPQKDEFYRFPQALMCTLRALVQALHFERAFFFKYSPRRHWLEPVAHFGGPVDTFDSLTRDVAHVDSQHMPDVQAIVQRKVVFEGDPIFEDFWPVVAFPAVWQDEVVGVFYADRKDKKDTPPLDTQEQVSIIALAEEWQNIPLEFY